MAKVADLELSQNSSVKKSAENELHMEIMKLGASFQFLFSPFQNPKFDPFSSEHPKPTFGPLSPVRYANPLNTALGPVAEVYAHTDKKFHSYMIEGDEFGDVVSIERSYIPVELSLLYNLIKLFSSFKLLPTLDLLLLNV